MEHRVTQKRRDRLMNKIICITLSALLFALCSAVQAQQTEENTENRVSYPPAFVPAMLRASRRFSKVCGSLAMSRVRTSALKPGFQRAKPKDYLNLSRSLSASKLMSFLLVARRLLDQPEKPPKQYRSLSPTSRIPLARDLSLAWHVPVATLPG